MATFQNRSFIHKVKQNKTLIFMLIPGLIFIIVFSYMPMVGMIVAFENFNLRDRFLSPFVGLKNFRFMFIIGDVWRVARNTILYNIAFMCVNGILSITCAIMFSELTSKWYKKVTQTVIFLPYFVSWVIAAVFAYSIFNYENGLINSILKAMHIESIDIYNNTSIWPLIIILFCAWKNMGYGSIVYLSAIMGIDIQIYESAEIDGASILKRIRHITLPCLTPTIIILMLFSIGNIFRGDFNMFYNLVGKNSVLYPVTDVVDTFVTRSLLHMPNVGMAASAGFVQSVVCFITILTANKLIKIYSEEYSLF
jgi:putative aldouronate transport system permease protein